MTKTFMPSARAANWLIAIGFLSLGYAFYLRYLVIEQSSVGLACDAGQQSWACLSRTIAMPLFRHDVFGWVGLGAAALAFIRPSLPLFGIAIAATGVGLVLYNTGLAGLAAAILVMCFARPVFDPDTESGTAR
jgi:hypothetical protein